MTLSFRQTFNKSTDDSQSVKLMSDSAPQYETPAFYISGHPWIVKYRSVNGSGDSLTHLLLFLYFYCLFYISVLLLPFLYFCTFTVFFIFLYFYCLFYRWLDTSDCCMWCVVCFTVVIDAGIFPITKTNFSLGGRNKMSLTLLKHEIKPWEERKTCRCEIGTLLNS